MSITKAAGFAMALAATGCASGQPAAKRKLANGMMTCGYQPLSTRVYIGSDLQARFIVRTNSEPCADAYAWNDLSASGTTLVTPPSHGKVDIATEFNQVVFVYQPDRGFTGTDRFRISTPGTPEATRVAITVTVEP